LVVERSSSYDNMRLESGLVIRSGNFILTKKVETLSRFAEMLTTQKSIFMRHRMYPSAFLMGWPIRLCMIWIRCGMVWETERINNNK